jgi:hypothetical protein
VYHTIIHEFVGIPGIIVSYSFSQTLCSKKKERRIQQCAAPFKRIFHTEILLCELAREFDQDPMGPAIGVSKQGHNDVTVAEV